MCTTLKELVALLWLGTYFIFVYHNTETASGASIYAIIGAVCYASAFPVATWALGAWLDGRATKKS